MPVVLARMAKNGVNWRQQSRVRFVKSRSETSGTISYSVVILTGTTPCDRK